MRLRFAVMLGSMTLTLGAASPPLEAQAQLTRMMVRVVAHDAKVIGSGVGGARITIRNLETGEILDEGIQEGTTGNTDLIMVKPRVRGREIYDVENTAGFVAEVPLSQPTRVEVIGEGPLGTPHATQRATKTLLLVPGQDILGDGIILELNGLTVSVESAPGEAVSGGSVEVQARVTMLCGCQFTPGGLWDADRVRVLARLVRGGRTITETELRYAGASSTFFGSLVVEGGGPGELRVLALDTERGNFGMATKALMVLED